MSSQQPAVRLTGWGRYAPAQILTDGLVSIPRDTDAQHPDARLTPGGGRPYANSDSWYDVVTARSAIGLSRDTVTLTLFTVDAKGGGSTSLAMADPLTGTARLLNTSSDNPSGRSVASSLAVFARVR